MGGEDGEIGGDDLTAPQHDAVIREGHSYEIQLLRKSHGDGQHEQRGKRQMNQARQTLPKGHTDAHAEKYTDEDHVVEIGEDPHLRRRPANDRQLKGQNAERH